MADNRPTSTVFVMKKNLSTRVVIILVVTLAALWVVLGPRRRPALQDFTLQGINNTLRENIRLGLDLRGGSHLVMQVKVEDYLGRLTTNAATGLQRAAAEQGYNLTAVRPEVNGNTYRVVAEAADASRLSDIREQLPQRVNDFDPTLWESGVSGNTVSWEMRDAAKKSLSERAVEDALRIIDTRINAIGVSEPTLQRHGAESAHQILLQMPGIDDPQRVKDLLIGESRLELVHVISTGGSYTYPTREAAVASLGGAVPQNRRVLEYLERDEPTAAGQTPNPSAPSQWVVVEVPPVIEGSDLRSASGEAGDFGENYQIGFTLKPAGAEKFGRWTAANVGQFMGVVLDDKVKSVATIQSQINDQGRITGSFTKESAEDLALTLRSGALPAKLVYLEERTVGPSLGQDSIRAGVTASLVGLILVVLFMVFY